MSPLKIKYDCENAKRDVDLFFSIGPSIAEGESAFWRAMRHIAHESTTEKHKITCKKCWRYFLREKRKILEKFEREEK